MQITIIAVGRIKERFYSEAVQEYSKRLGRYCKLNIIEVDDEPTPDNASDSERERILAKEADRIISKIPDGAYVMTLEIRAREYSSEEFAECIDGLGISGISHIVFIIGGSLGLHDSVLRLKNGSVSFSRMTFPHQLMRVILLEQIYRAWRIIRHEPYHK